MDSRNLSRRDLVLLNLDLVSSWLLKKIKENIVKKYEISIVISSNYVLNDRLFGLGTVIGDTQQGRN